MDIRVLGVHMEVGDALTQYIEEHIERHVNKYFDTAITADVHFSKQASQFHVNLVINEGVKNGVIIKSDGLGSDAYVCFNEALEKAVVQLRKYKEKIKNHRREEGGLKKIIIDSEL